MPRNLLEHLNAAFSYEPVQYHDSWLSIDPIIGCRHNCQYCYLRLVKWTGVRPVQIISTPDILRLLETNRYFIPHKTPLALGNCTDMFLPENIPTALEIARELDQRGYRNSLTFITKKLIPENALKELTSLRHIKPIFFLSYSGLPPTVEKGVNAEETRSNFQSLAAYGLPVIHYWRPLLKINGSPDRVEAMLDFVTDFARASVYMGLRYSPALQELFASDDHLHLPELDGIPYGNYIAPGVEAKMRQIAAEKYPHYPLYTHSSCALSFALGKPDYTATVYDRVCTSSTCANKQRGICSQARRIPNALQVQTLLDHLGVAFPFRITEKCIEVDGELSQQDFCFLLHNLNYPVQVKVSFTRMWRGDIFSSGYGQAISKP